MTTSSTTNETKVRYAMYVIEIAIMLAAWGITWGKMASKVEHVEKTTQECVKKEVFDLHKADDDGRFTRLEQMLIRMDAKLDVVIQKEGGK